MNEPAYLDEAFRMVCHELEQLFIAKHKDYGKGNIVETGELGIAFRVNDKLSRLKNILLNNKTPEHESIDETWMDIAVYSIIAVLYRRGWFEKYDLEKK